MKASRFFSELSSTYAFEIEDLTWDSGGDNVLASRLKTKRSQFADLLPMCESAPEMVAPAFRGGLGFSSHEALGRLVASNPDDFPSWDEVAGSIEFEPWAEKLKEQALAAPGGEQFMLVVAGLEYLLAGHAPAAAPVEAEGSGKEDADDEGDGDDAEDLADAGEDYLSDQGFDRRS
ncbi:MAG: hypothetical protein EBS65_16340 [Betaproteobacteria bacterium]|nr:hypothetical protein [Betaproteobacteria bacterium]